MIHTTRFHLSIFLASLLVGASSADAKPIKVFILAGQSNMEGHAKVETFDYIGDDPNTAPLLTKMRGSDGKPRVCDGVWISYLTGIGDNVGEGFGKLTTGYGARRNPERTAERSDPSLRSGSRWTRPLMNRS